MKYLDALVPYVFSTALLTSASPPRCKCTPNDTCWPSSAEWSAFNDTLSGRLYRGVPPASVCYPSQPNYNEDRCAFVRSQWFNSTWHAEDPISIDYPIWTNNSCNPIYPNGTSLTGDVNAGKRGCSIGNYPAYVVNATSAEHVSKALKWAGKKNIRVVVKSTGHSFAGRSTGYGSLSIWTHNIRGIEYMDSFKPTSCPIQKPLNAVRVGAGHTGVDVQAALSKFNRIAVTGANPDVGVIGWLTGGGHGALSTTYGMGADNLLEATIVTPDGKVLVANPCQHSDIFFAIRGGGGGTYGVVLQVVLATYPSPRTTQHSLTVSSLSVNTSTEFWDLVGFIHAEMPRLKAGGMQGYYYMMGPPVFPTLSLFWGFLVFDKPNGTVERLIAPIEERLRRDAHLFAYESEILHSPNFWDLWRHSTNQEVASGGSAIGSRLLSAESLSDASATAKVFAQVGPDPLGSNAPIANPILVGHMIAHPNEPSYYPDVISMNPAWRKTLTHFIVIDVWPDGVAPEVIRTVYQDLTNNKTEQLRRLSPDTGAYLNEADAFEPEWQKSFFGKHYGRLRKIKQKYDPNNVLWCRQCVGSEALIEREDGGLCENRA
ncbi:FAD-binding domain-containing protein [Westerdykella ornata]|uniref:FAD-binding domain-containing protein n=1 Tax=Westerdykella ornata TaxID=318751 RepID=A0A6A6JXX3_WESOR|nr:FAD-binding domain-containing protein [Westerdykella ornata]KAF2281462.1 FAD-binding domain-containing protein [Westerdykella ornata]